MRVPGILLILLIVTAPLSADSDTSIIWQNWEAGQAQARDQNKILLLDLEAVWCHWCHVMDRTTYRDSRVVGLLSEKVVAVKVDQDARPDLAARYEDYGWPATIIFDSQGRELVKLSGYVGADELSSLLEELIDDPSPRVASKKIAAQGSGDIGPQLLGELQERHLDLYDEKLGGWGTVHKFVNSRVLEYCLQLAEQGDEKAEKMARQTLAANLVLVDPVWGGVYQYSDSGRWDSPHFEKIMSSQAGNLMVYALAHNQLGDERFRQAALAIAHYMLTFLRSPEGFFFVSQDADLIRGKKASDYFALDDKGRRRLGVPRVDTQGYARENGWAIEALAHSASLLDQPALLQAALEAARWVLAERSLPDGGFRHGPGSQQLFLGDTLACGRAFLSLYQATGERVWLERSLAALDFVEQNFRRDDIDGYLTTPKGETRSREDNIDLARWANLCYHHSGRPEHRQMAQRALALFAIPEMTHRYNPGGILLAERELAGDPVHLTVVGRDQLGSQLYEAARKVPLRYRRLDWWQPGTPPLPHTVVAYPELPQSAAFLCQDGRCSRPVTSVQALLKLLGQE